MKKLKEILFLSDKGYTDLKKAIIACTITNLAMLLPFCITVMVFSELLNPFLGQELDWQNIWLLWGAGIISAIIVFLASMIYNIITCFSRCLCLKEKHTYDWSEKTRY